jgi:hypothetical protein
MHRTVCESQLSYVDTNAEGLLHFLLMTQARCANRAQDFKRGLQISKNLDQFLLSNTGSGCSLIV